MVEDIFTFEIIRRDALKTLIRIVTAGFAALVFLTQAGIEIVGPLPGDLQDTAVFAAAIMGSVRDAAASKALVNFLRTPEAAAVMKAKGMEPG